MVTMVYLLGIALMGNFSTVLRKVKSKVQTEVLFADDMANGVPAEEKMQKGVDQVADSCDSYDLTISIKKTSTKYTNQPAPGKPYKEPTITVKGQRLQVVHKFTYLGSTLSRVKLCTLMMKSMLGLPKLVQHSASYVEVFGTEVESDLRQSWKYTDWWGCQHHYTHAKLGQFTNTMPKDWTTSIQAVLETSKDQVARQDSRQ